MSSADFIISFVGDTCPDCYRPFNAGGVHNPGCRLSQRRWCVLCESIHDKGEDVHRDFHGNYCSTDYAVARLAEMWPGRSHEYVLDHVNKRLRKHTESYEVVKRMQSDPAFVRAVMAAQLAKGGG